MSNTVVVKPKVKRPGSGRTKGSFSFVKIPLSDLNAKFADASTQIVVSRKWAEQVGFTGITSAPAVKIAEQIVGQTPEVQASVTIETFDDEEASETQGAVGTES